MKTDEELDALQHELGMELIARDEEGDQEGQAALQEALDEIAAEKARRRAQRLAQTEADNAARLRAPKEQLEEGEKDSKDAEGEQEQGE